MGSKSVIMIIIGILFLSLVYAQQQNVYNNCKIYGNCLPEVSTIINQSTNVSGTTNFSNATDFWDTNIGSLKNVNVSQFVETGGFLTAIMSYWDNLYCQLTGCTMTGNITAPFIFAKINASNVTNAPWLQNVTDLENIGFNQTVNLTDFYDQRYLTSLLALFFYNNSDSFNSTYTVMNTSIPRGGTSQLDRFTSLPTGKNLLTPRILTELNLTILQSGGYDQHTTIDFISGTKNVQLQSEIFKKLANQTEILIGQSPVSQVLTNGVFQQVEWTGVVNNDTLFAEGDRLVMRLYAVVSGLGSNPTIDLVVADNTAARLDIGVDPIDIRINEVDPKAYNGTLAFLSDILNWNYYNSSNFSIVDYYNKSQVNDIFLRQDGTKPLTANWNVGGLNITNLSWLLADDISLEFGDLISELNPDAVDAIRIKGTNDVDVVLGDIFGTSYFSVWNAADDTAVFYVNNVGDTDILGDLTIGDDIFMSEDGIIGISASTERIMFDGTGGNINLLGANVGIGQEIPVTKLHVEGSSYFLNNLFMNQSDGGYWLNDFNSFTHGFFRNAGGDLFFRATDDAITILDTTGFVGMGTSSPQKDLQIESTVPTLRLSDSNAGTDQAVATLIEFYRGNNANRVGFFGMESSSNDIMKLATDYAAGEIAFSTGSSSEAVRIDSDGNVGIGTSTPQQTLNVIGDINATGLIYGNGSQITDLDTNETVRFNTSVGSGCSVGAFVTSIDVDGTLVCDFTPVPTLQNLWEIFDDDQINSIGASSPADIFVFHEGNELSSVIAGAGINYSLTGLREGAWNVTGVLIANDTLGVGVDPSVKFHVQENDVVTLQARIENTLVSGRAIFEVMGDSAFFDMRAHGTNYDETLFGMNMSDTAALIGRLGEFIIGTFENEDLIFGTNNVERMRILKDGSVTIEGSLSSLDSVSSDLYTWVRGAETDVKTYSNADEAESSFYQTQNFPSTNQFDRVLDIVAGPSNTGSWIRLLTGAASSSPTPAIVIDPNHNINITSLVSTYTGGSAHVCVFNNGSLFASEGACP